MPASNIDEGGSVSASQSNNIAQSIAKLTPEQMRQLAALLYAMLRDDLRTARARNQDGLLRR